VAEHEFGDWPAEHRRKFDTEKTPTPGVSFESTFLDCVMFTKSLEVSEVAVGEGVTVGVMVAVRARDCVSEI
jgi:hypothetical protein